MSVFKRKGSPHYYYRFTYKKSEYYSTTGSGRREEAEQVEARIKRKLWEKNELGIKNQHTWISAIIKFEKERDHLASWSDYWFTLEMFNKEFKKIIPGATLEDITRDIVTEILDKYQDERECSNARINRMTSHLRSLLNLAAGEWEWLDVVPKLRLYKERDKMPRWLTIAEAKTLIKAAPQHLKDPIRFSLLSGVRKANCLDLQWSWIDMTNNQITVPNYSTKANNIIVVPITDEIRKIIVRNTGKHETNVFTYAGKPFHQVMNETWKTAIKSAGIKDFRWHDLRHTWASWHVMNGTSLAELMDLAGWSTYAMVKRYAHLNVDHLRKAAGNVSINEDFGKLLEIKK